MSDVERPDGPLLPKSFSQPTVPTLNPRQTRPHQSVASMPSHGSLILVGGIRPGPAINSAFVSLTGGASSHIVMIPTASIGDAGPPGWVPFLRRRMKETFAWPTLPCCSRSTD